MNNKNIITFNLGRYGYYAILNFKNTQSAKKFVKEIIQPTLKEFNIGDVGYYTKKEFDKEVLITYYSCEGETIPFFPEDGEVFFYQNSNMLYYKYVKYHLTFSRYCHYWTSCISYSGNKEK